MARSKKSIKSIAAQVVRRAPIRTTPKKQRTGRKDIKTPQRKDITLRAEAITRGGPLTKSAFALLKQDFPDENLKWNFVRKQLNFYRQQIEQSVPTAAVEWGRKRKHCGRQAIKFTPEVAQLLIDVNNKHWGQLSFKRLAGKLAELDIDVTPMTIRKWCLELGMVRRRRYIKPKLTLTHRVNRLEFVLSQINKWTAEFTTLEDTVHGDEKWFFLMKDGQVCRVFPDKNGKYKVPAAPKVFHKSRMPKIMFLAVCAKPRNEYGFDGRIGLWSFTLERFAKRSNIRTGTVVGESLMLEDVSVDARAYREKIINKDGVFDAMRQRMWWFHSDARYRTNEQGVRIPCGQLVAGKWKFKATHGSRCPEAGQVLHYQHDGARPHTERVNTQLFRSHGAMKGFNIQVLVQPAQSPDLNVDDLAFFRSLQSDVSLVAKGSRRDLLAAVVQCWNEYPAEKMEAVWLCLYTSYRGVLESVGGNEYIRHSGMRSLRGTSAVRKVQHRVITEATKKLKEMKARLDRGAESSGSEGDNDDDESSEGESD